MALTHSTIKAAGERLFAVADWNVGHVLSGSTGQIPFQIAANQIGQDPLLFWDNTNKRLGIGTAVPSQKLDILNGNINLSNGYGLGVSFVGSESYISFNTSTQETVNIFSAARINLFADTNNNTDSIAFRVHANSITAGTGEILTLLENGSLGIGTVNPTSRLHVGGTGTWPVTLHKAVSGGATILSLLHSTGTIAAPAQSAQNHGSYIVFKGTDAAGAPQITATMGSKFTAAAITDASSPSTIVLSTTPVGAVATTEKVYIGPAGIISFEGTTGALLLHRLTTAQRNALAAVNGMIIYNTDTNKIEGYEAGSWVDI